MINLTTSLETISFTIYICLPHNFFNAKYWNKKGRHQNPPLYQYSWLPITMKLSRNLLKTCETTSILLSICKAVWNSSKDLFIFRHFTIIPIIRNFYSYLLSQKQYGNEISQTFTTHELVQIPHFIFFHNGGICSWRHHFLNFEQTADVSIFSHWNGDLFTLLYTHPLLLQVCQLLC